MPTDFKSLSLNNLLKLQQQQQLQFANESLFKPYFNHQSSNVIMTETNNCDSVKNNRLCSEDDSNSNDSDLSVGQEKVQNQQHENNNLKESPHSEDDEMSNASSSQYTNSSTRLCSPQEIMRPTMHFHEEILRSSQLYAEELLRQRIAAAARLQSSVSDVKSSPDEPEPSIISKLNFQSSLFNRTAAAAAASTNTENGNNLFCAKSAINFQNIHSHLSSIAQITHSLGSSGSNHHHHMKKDDASLSSLSRESSQSPSGFHHHNQHKLGFHTISTHQNQLNEHNLKFSIDNILKADFGRRITEPLLKSSKVKRSLRDGKHEKDKVNVYKSNSNNKIGNKGINGSAEGQQTTNDKSMDQTFSSNADTNSSKMSSGASSTATKTDANGTVWPAWVGFLLPLLLRVTCVVWKLILFIPRLLLFAFFFLLNFQGRNLLKNQMCEC